MNRPRNGRDYAGVVAVILSVVLGLVLLMAMAAALFGREINEGAQRLLTTIGAGLVGALATYVGTAHRGRRRNGRDDQGAQGD